MGDIEFGTCQMCGNDAPLSRKYYYYLVKCSCCGNANDNHFEIVRHCNNCTPKPPVRITITKNPFMVEGY